MTSTEDIAAVSGATGFIGSAVVRKLLGAGRKVRALIEPGVKLDNLEGLPSERLELVTVDICDRDGMHRALEGASAFYHLAAIYRIWMPDPAPLYRVNIEGTTTALLAAQAAGVRRIVYTSSIAAIGLHADGTPADESTPFNLWDIANDYILSKYHAERVALRMAEAGAPIVIVSPALPFGPGDIRPTPTGAMVLALLRGEVPGVGEGGFCAVDVDDVADGHLAAEARGRIGEKYILGNHNITFKAFCELVCDVAGRKPPRLPLPSALAQGVALGMELWADHVSHERPNATYRSVRYLQRLAYFDGSKAQRELGVTVTPLRDSIEREIAYFELKGMVRPRGRA
ncbi:NAD-dependent epimerase/dehydratase family protein [Polyangium aurulentum]|uniref:NAD-dependent epimerase/dehydratase family protein n=1 Tax=Polyangium aurulentum TaxID=2567896 RepID=UPI00146D2019|nr:NAD-dependent epimerase/dehydratase family protein [Polyangium aurulentum]UQA55086.1 NAD-dependent epimerase/dehydratase family protein [Polyangium aurulentum]